MKLDIQIPSYYTEQNMFSSVSPLENFHLSVDSGKLVIRNTHVMPLPNFGHRALND